MAGDKMFKTMYICMATDVNIESLLAEQYGEYSRHYTHHILVSFKIYHDGLVEVQPAMSKILSEPAVELPSDLTMNYSNTLNPFSSNVTQAPSIFLDDRTVEMAKKKGTANLVKCLLTYCKMCWVSYHRSRCFNSVDWDMNIYGQTNVYGKGGSLVVITQHAYFMMIT